MPIIEGQDLVTPDPLPLLAAVVPSALDVLIAFRVTAVPTCDPRDRSAWTIDEVNDDLVVVVWLNRVAQQARLHPGFSPFTVWLALLIACLQGIAALLIVQEETGRITADRDVPVSSRHLTELAEARADAWLAALRQHDPRLGAPPRLFGYLGRRISREKRALEAYAARAEVDPKRYRCGGKAQARLSRLQRALGSGFQLGSGHVLDRSGLPRSSRAYEKLSEISAELDIGTVVVDGAGRVHRYYDDGDVVLLVDVLRRAWKA